MDKFDQVYQSIISEAKFESKKWIEKETIKEMENHHVKDFHATCFWVCAQEE